MKKQKLCKAGDIVEIVWHDASGKHSGWVDIEDALGEVKPMEVNSAGFVLKHDKECIMICHSISEDEQVIAPLAIPSGWIKSLKQLS